MINQRASAHLARKLKANLKNEFKIQQRPRKGIDWNQKLNVIKSASSTVSTQISQAGTFKGAGGGSRYDRS